MGVFIGDDGQGDCAAGMTMAKTMRGVEAVFIHAIRKYPQNKCREPKVSKCEADPVLPPKDKVHVEVPSCISTHMPTLHYGPTDWGSSPLTRPWTFSHT